jgi:hypothetical protein
VASVIIGLLITIAVVVIATSWLGSTTASCPAGTLKVHDAPQCRTPDGHVVPQPGD